MNIAEYSKSQDSLENREKALFEMLDTLDKDSFELFGEIIDLDVNSSQDLEKLIVKTRSLIQTYLETNEAFNYLYVIEAKSYIYILGRLLLKSSFGLTASVTFIIINIIQHIYSMLFVLLSISLFYVNQIRANRKFSEEYTDTYDKTLKFDEKKLKRIKDTLDNCSRLLSGKIKQSGDNGLDSVITFADYYLSLYSNNMITIDEIETLPLGIKNIMIIILNQKLNKNEHDLSTLLTAFSNKNKELKLKK